MIKKKIQLSKIKIDESQIDTEGEILNLGRTTKYNLFFAVWMCYPIDGKTCSQFSTPYEVSQHLKQDIEHFTKNGKHTELSMEIFNIQRGEWTVKEKLDKVKNALRNYIRED